MEWSYGKNRMASVLERLLEPRPEKPKTFFEKYLCCFSSNTLDARTAKFLKP